MSSIQSGKNIARRTLHAAVASGEVIKPTQCSECGNVGTMHGHHDDYSKPLAVDWLCSACHGLRHRKDVRLVQVR